MTGRSEVRAAVGDWMRLLGHPAAGSDLAADLADEPWVTPVRLDEVADESGVSYVADPHPDPAVGVNWVRVPRGVHHVQVGLWCRPPDAACPGGSGFVASFVFGWWRREEVWEPDQPSDVGAGPLVVVPRFVHVPAGRPGPSDRPVPLYADALVHVPTAGHVSVLMGSDQALSPDGEHPIELLLVRVG